MGVVRVWHRAGAQDAPEGTMESRCQTYSGTAEERPGLGAGEHPPMYKAHAGSGIFKSRFEFAMRGR